MYSPPTPHQLCPPCPAPHDADQLAEGQKKPLPRLGLAGRQGCQTPPTFAFQLRAAVTRHINQQEGSSQASFKGSAHSEA